MKYLERDLSSRLRFLFAMSLCAGAVIGSREEYHSIGFWIAVVSWALMILTFAFEERS